MNKLVIGFLVPILFLCCRDKVNKNKLASKDVNTTVDTLVSVVQDAMVRNKYWENIDIRAKYYNRIANRYLLKDSRNESILMHKELWYSKYDKVYIVDTTYIKDNGLFNCMLMSVDNIEDTLRVNFSVYNGGYCYSYHYIKNRANDYVFLNEKEIRFKPKFNKLWEDVRVRWNMILRKGGYNQKSFFNKKYLEKDSLYIYIDNSDTLLERTNKHYCFYYNDYRILHNERVKKSKQLAKIIANGEVMIPEEPKVTFQVVGKPKVVEKLQINIGKMLNRRNWRNYRFRYSNTSLFLVERNSDGGYIVSRVILRSNVY